MKCLDLFLFRRLLSRKEEVALYKESVVGPNPLSPRFLPADERWTEVSRILAAGLVRAIHRKTIAIPSLRHTPGLTGHESSTDRHAQ